MSKDECVMYVFIVFFVCVTIIISTLAICEYLSDKNEEIDK